MTNFDQYLKEQLVDDKNLSEYINATLEQYFIDHNKELFLLALKEAIKAKGGATKISQKTHINRQHIYKMLSGTGNPSFDNIVSLLSALGLHFEVKLNHYTMKS